MRGRGAPSAAGEPSRVAVFGAAPDTWNLGVSALLTSTLAAVERCAAGTHVSVFDNGFGQRSDVLDIGGNAVPVNLIGARHSKRLHRPDTLWHIVASGLVGAKGNPAVRTLRESAAVLDVSGGDSFSDIYGWERLTQMLLHKQITLRQGRPLILLPQTYGPFNSSLARNLAIRVVRRADVAMARDPWSYEQLQALLGDGFDPTRHWSGVDLAFGLPAAEPSIDDDTATWLQQQRPLAGVNVSGMLYLDAGSREQFGLADDYRRAMKTLVRALLDHTDASILLIPHVVAPAGHPQSDSEAAQLLAAEFPEAGPRIRVAPAPKTASEAKGLIAKTDWFTGSRMHATIASLSSGVPSAAIAYSVKAAGVFATAGMSDHVTDARQSNADEISERLIWSFENRDFARVELETVTPTLRESALGQVCDALNLVGVADGPGATE